MLGSSCHDPGETGVFHGFVRTIHTVMGETTPSGSDAGNRADRESRDRLRGHLRKALESDCEATKNYHLRSALQALLVEEELGSDSGR